MTHPTAPCRAAWLALAPLLVPFLSAADPAYRTPSAPLAAIVDAPSAPVAVLSPDRTRLLLLDRPEAPSIAELAQPELKLAGLLHDAAEAYCGDMVKPLKNCLKDFAEYEDAVWRVIAARFNVSPELLPEVKKADRIALAAEMRDLFGQEVTIDQPARDVADRLVPGIVPLNPTAAKLKFAQELDRLQSERLQ